MTRFASVGRDQGIPMHEQELREWQEQLALGAQSRIAAPVIPVVSAGDFIKDALALFVPPPAPDGETT